MKVVNVDEVLELLISELYENIIKTIISETKLDQSSSLIQSVEILRSGSQIMISMNDYAKFLDAGRSPNMPKVPYRSLLRWILQKKIQINNYTPRQLAFVLQNSIKKKGIRPRNFLKAVEKDLEDITGFVLEEEIRKGLESSLENLFTI